MLRSILPERMGQKFLSPWKQLIFEMFVSIDRLGPQKKILSFAQGWSQYVLCPYRLFCAVCHVRYYEKKGQIFFSLETMPLQKIVFSTTPWVLKNAIISFSNCQNYFWTITNNPRSFVTLDNRKKRGLKFFITGKIAFFWKIWFSTS